MLSNVYEWGKLRHSKFQANAAHCWTLVPLNPDLRRWSRKKLVLRFGSQIAQRRGLGPRYSYASICSVVEINLVPRAEFLTTNIQAGSSLQPAGKIWGVVHLLREAWQILLTRSITTAPCICWETKPSSRLGIQRKGFPFQVYILLSFVLYAGHTGSKIQEAEWFESLFLKVPGIMYHQDGNVHFFKFCYSRSPWRSRTVSHSKHGKQPSSLTCAAKWHILMKSKGVGCHSHASRWE